MNELPIAAHMACNSRTLSSARLPPLAMRVHQTDNPLADGNGDHHHVGWDFAAQVLPNLALQVHPVGRRRSAEGCCTFLGGVEHRRH
jgi:hypothetical protein